MSFKLKISNISLTCLTNMLELVAILQKPINQILSSSKCLQFIERESEMSINYLIVNNKCNIIFILIFLIINYLFELSIINS